MHSALPCSGSGEQGLLLDQEAREGASEQTAAPFVAKQSCAIAGVCDPLGRQGDRQFPRVGSSKAVARRASMLVWFRRHRQRSTLGRPRRGVRSNTSLMTACPRKQAADELFAAEPGIAGHAIVGLAQILSRFRPRGRGLSLDLVARDHGAAHQVAALSGGSVTRWFLLLRVGLHCSLGHPRRCLPPPPGAATAACPVVQGPQQTSPSRRSVRCRRCRAQ